MNKELLVYTIPTCVYSYVLYNYYNSRYKKKLDESTKNLEKKDNIYDFLNDLNDYCSNGKDNCLLSYNITEYAYKYIKEHGIDDYLDKLNREPDIFETDKEYVFIYKENEIEEENIKGNMLNLYHVDKIINKKYTTNAKEALEEKCGKGKCDIMKIMKQIKQVTDKYKNGGFIEYYWFDVKTQETIVKKSFVKKIENVKYKGKNTNLYIGSGHTLKKIQQEFDFLKLNLLFINSLLFVTMWIFFDMKFTLKSKTLSFTILLFSTIYLSLLMIDSYKLEYSVSEYETQIQNIMVSGKILATFTSSLIIYLNLVKPKRNNSLYRLLVIALLFTLLSSIYYTSEDREIVSYIYLLKNISIINASLTLFLSFILVTLNKILKK